MPSKASSSIIVRELKTKQEIYSIYPLIKHLNKDMTQKTFKTLLEEMLPRGYRCIGAYQGKKLVGVTGFWVGYRFWCYKFIDLDNVVVDPKARSKGVGKKMTDWVAAEGKRLKCKITGLDTYVTSYGSHRFYLREGYNILGYHLVKKL